MENVSKILNNGLGIVFGELSKAGFDANGELFEQAIMSEPPTTEIDGFALQLTETLLTPTAMDIKRWAETRNKNCRGKLTDHQANQYR